MGQIPVFTGRQIVDPSSPVPAVNTESARIQGESLAQMGNAMFTLGNALDVAAKQAKAKVDKIKPGIAVDQYRLEALKMRAQLESEGLQEGDDPSGKTVVERYQERMKPIAAHFTSQMDNEEQRGLFLNGIGETDMQQASMALATEVKKREENVQVMEQDFVRTKAMTAREKPEMAEQLMNELEAFYLKDPLQPQAKVNEKILAGKKEIASETLAGIVSQAQSSPTSAYWQASHDLLNKKFAHLFTQEELQKKNEQMYKDENDTYSRWWTYRQNTLSMEEQHRKEADEAAQDKYMSMYQQAGNDQAKLDAVNNMIAMDGNLKPETARSMLNMRQFAETRDDRYEGVFLTRLYRGKHTAANFVQMRKELNDNYYKDHIVSADRRNKLLKTLEDMEQNAKENPNIGRYITQLNDQIGKLGPYTIDAAGVYHYENQSANEVLQSRFLKKVADSGKDITPGQVQSMFNSVVKDSPYKPGAVVNWTNPSNLTTSQGIRDTNSALAKQYRDAQKRGDAKGMQDALKKAKELKSIGVTVNAQEQNKIEPNQSKGNQKLFDE